MKTIRIIILLLLFSVPASFTRCTKGSNNVIHPVALINPDTISFPHSMKGWELYNWPNGNDWNYSILIGTNRIKSYSEVTGNRIIVLGTDSLKMLLNKFPENENIFWIGKGWLKKCWGNDYGDLCLPDNKTLNDIKQYCENLNLVLGISE
jgi:hypothetical protein